MHALTDFARRKHTAAALLEAASEAVAPVDPVRADALRTAAKRARDAAFHVLLIGPFSSGKSTLLNALLSAAALPVRVNPCTALPTELRWAEERRATLVHADGGHEDLPVDTFLSDIRLGPDGEDRWNEVQRAILHWPLPLLQDGVVLVDTPGLDDDPSRTARTLADLDRADAVVMVSPATRFLSATEQRLVAQELAPRGLDNLFVVGTMLDLAGALGSDADDLLPRLTARAEEVFGDLVQQPNTQRIWWVDGRGALKRRRAGVAAPDLDAFEAALARFLVDGRGAAWASRWAGLVNTIRSHLSEQQALEAATMAQSRDALQARAASLRPQLDELDQTAERLDAVAAAFIREQQDHVAAALARMVREAEAELPLVVSELPLRRTAGLGWLTEAGRSRLETEIRDALEAWLETRTQRWSAALRAELDGTLEKLRVEVSAETQSFDSAVEALAAALGEGARLPSAPLLTPPEINPAERWFSVALGAALASPGTVVAGWAEGYSGAIKGATGRLAARLALVAAGALLGPVGWAGLAVYALTDAAVVVLSGDAQRDAIRRQLTQALAGRLTAELPAWQVDVRESVAVGLAPVRQALADGPRREAEALRQAVEHALQNAAATEAERQQRAAAWVRADVALAEALESLSS